MRKKGWRDGGREEEGGGAVESKGDSKNVGSVMVTKRSSQQVVRGEVDVRIGIPCTREEKMSLS